MEHDERLRDAALAFLARLDLITPAINDAFAFKQNHGFQYAGPTWEFELAALRKAVTNDR